MGRRLTVLPCLMLLLLLLLPGVVCVEVPPKEHREAAATGSGARGRRPGASAAVAALRHLLEVQDLQLPGHNCDLRLLLLLGGGGGRGRLCVKHPGDVFRSGRDAVVAGGRLL